MNDELEVESYESVWDIVSDTPEEAANLRLRSELMDQIITVVEENGWTQVLAARNCGVNQPRMNDLLHGRISHFSLDALVNILSSLGRRIHVKFEIVDVHKVA